MAFQNFQNIFNNSLRPLEIEFLSLSETIIQFSSIYAAYIFSHYLVLFNICYILLSNNFVQWKLQCRLLITTWSIFQVCLNLYCMSRGLQVKSDIDSISHYSYKFVQSLFTSMVSLVSLTREKLLWDIGTLCEKRIALTGEIEVEWPIARKRLSGTFKNREDLGRKQARNTRRHERCRMGGRWQHKDY